MKLTIKDILSLITVVGTFAVIWGIGSGALQYTSDMVKGLITGGLLQWDAWIFLYYFRRGENNE